MMEGEHELHWTPLRLPSDSPVADRLPPNFYDTHIAFPEGQVLVQGQQMLSGHTACGMPFIASPHLGMFAYDNEVTCYACYMNADTELEAESAVEAAEAILRGDAR